MKQRFIVFMYQVSMELWRWLAEIDLFPLQCLNRAKVICGFILFLLRKNI